MAKGVAAKRKGKTYNETEDAPKGRNAVMLATGLFLFALAGYTFISMLFYVFTWAEDQSLLTNKDLFNEFVDVENGGGVFGYLWSHFLVSRLFGLGAFVIPFFLFALALYALRIRKTNLLRLVLISVSGTIIISLIFSFIFSFTSFDTWFGSGAGGSYGYYVNQWMCNIMGSAGTGLLLLFLFSVWAMALDRRVVTWFNNLFDKLIDRIQNFSLRKKKASEGAALQASAEAEQESAIAGAAAEGTDQQPEYGSELEPDLSFETDIAPVSAEAAAGTMQASVSREPEFVVIDNGPVPEPADPAESEEAIDGTVKANREAADRFIADAGAATGETDRAGDEDGTDVSGQQEKEEEEAVTKDDGVKPIEVIENEDSQDFLKELSEEALSTLFDPRLDLPNYKSPTIDLLEDYKDMIFVVSMAELEKNNKKIVKTLGDYHIGVEKISARIGPTVTLYEIVPAAGVRVSQIKRLEEDIALSLAARGVRVVTLVGTNAIGIEVANEKPSVVPIKSVLSDPKFQAVKTKYDLPIVIGRTISNEPMIFDLAKMPHLLVAGATGQGKSVGLNAILASLLYTKHPSELKLVLVDPKKVELSLYSRLENHFLAKIPDSEDAIITDTQKVIYTLKSLCIEMDSRYDLLKAAKVRNIKEYNEKFLSRRLNPNKGHRFMPFIVVIIDEFADLLMTAGREIEEPIARLAQLARAIGIHLVIATQRPTTNIITGSIKANFPARIAFRVISSVDSKTILDQTGANQLIGKGDMLISTGSDLTRVQCAFIDTKEVERISEYIGAQRGYSTAYYLPEYVDDNQDAIGVGEVDLLKRDKLFEDAARLVVSTQQGSTSMIQRKMNLGYNRAGRIMDQLEAAGIVGPYEGSKTRQVLITDFNSLDKILKSL